MKTFTSALLVATALMALRQPSFAQKPGPPKALLPVPTKEQLAWHRMEVNAFIHFTTNTFTGKEWGDGDAKESVFNPTALDAEQWARVLKQGGIKGMILTCKHHDGFCLWPTKYTDYSVKNSPFRNGDGSVVREAANACRKYGLKFGVYLSPWDRNQGTYGTPEYITYYRNQLKELLTYYGPIFEIWFDGANGGSGYYGGARETRKIDASTYYQWPTTIAMAKKLQPQVIFFSDAGPDLRWVGNENGVAGETNWNTLSPDTLYAGKSGINGILNAGSPDGKKWIPAEVDVSIRPGWFYHAKEDDQVKTPERLFEIYLTSVGRGSTLLLNLPPDQRGLINEIDAQSLKGFRELVDRTFSDNLATGAKITASNYRGGLKTYNATNLADGNPDTYWATDDRVRNASVVVELKKASVVQYLMLQEYIQLGQRVKSFSVDVWKDDDWKPVASGTTIGYKRILKLPPTETTRVRVTINDAKACPILSTLGIY